jgi:hypothetical protein
VGAAKKLYAGALVGLFGGYLEPMSEKQGLIVVGVMQEQVDNTAGAAGDLKATAQKGVYRFANSANADAITDSDVGSVCFAVDDQTVAKTDNGATRSPAGKIVQVDTIGVWVAVGADVAGVGPSF